MEVTNLAFDVGAFNTSRFIFSKPYGMTITGIGFDFAHGSIFDELSVYAISKISAEFMEDALTYTRDFSIRSISESSIDAINMGNVVVVFSIPDGESIDELKTSTPNYPIPSYPIKLLSRYEIMGGIPPNLLIRTSLPSTDLIRARPTDGKRDIAFFYRTLIESVKGISIASLLAVPVVAEGKAKFSVLIEYINKTSINKRCKLSLYSAITEPDANLISGTIMNPPSISAPFGWMGGDMASYKELLSSCIGFGSVGPPEVQQYIVYSAPHQIEAFDYWGAVLDDHDRLFFIPYNRARNPIWHYMHLPSKSIHGYEHGIAPAHLAPAAAYRGGVLDKKGRIVLCPYGQWANGIGLYHFIDVVSLSGSSYAGPLLAEAPHPGADDEYKFMPAMSGGVASRDGRIFFLPYGGSDGSTFLGFDPDTDSMFGYGTYNGQPLGSSGMYRGGQVDLINGRIYLIPRVPARSNIMHFIDTSMPIPLLIPYPTSLFVNEQADEPFRCMSMPLGDIMYLIPWGQAVKDKWEAVDTRQNVAAGFAKPSGTPIKPSFWQKAVLSSSGKLFLIPRFRDEITREWQYIHYPRTATERLKVVSYATADFVDNYTDGVLWSDGCIYLIPTFEFEQTAGDRWTMLRIDTKSSQGFHLSICNSPEFNHL